MSIEKDTIALPQGLATMRLFTALSLRQAKRSRLLRVAALLMSLPVLATLAAALSSKTDAAFFQLVAKWHIVYLAPLLLALFSNLSVAEDVQSKTITYVFSRPIPRWTLPVGKYLGMVSIASFLLSVSLIGCYLLAMLPEGGAVFTELPAFALAWIATLLAAIYFGAVASAFGALVTGAPFAVMLFYVLAVDVGMSFVPGWAKVVSMSVHLQSIAGLYQPSRSYFTTDPELTIAISLPILITVTLVWLIVAVAVTHSSEFKSSR